ncbi:MAG: Spy/CpxP family protein refolding chaperone [bacterium]|nr:Spy/CpxP family protein refolding chaperone [bacterium]
MSKKVLIWLLIFSLLLNFAVVVTFAYFRWIKAESRPETRFHERPRKSFQKRLNLSDEQMRQMGELRAKLFTEIRPIKAQIFDHRMELIDLVARDSVNSEQLYQKIELITDLEKQIHLKTTENLLLYRTILTPEQREIFIKLVMGKMFGGEREASRHQRFKKMKLNPDSVKIK